SVRDQLVHEPEALLVEGGGHAVPAGRPPHQPAGAPGPLGRQAVDQRPLPWAQALQPPFEVALRRSHIIRLPRRMKHKTTRIANAYDGHAMQETRTTDLTEQVRAFYADYARKLSDYAFDKLGDRKSVV